LVVASPSGFARLVMETGTPDTGARRRPGRSTWPASGASAPRSATRSSVRPGHTPSPDARGERPSAGFSGLSRRESASESPTRTIWLTSSFWPFSWPIPQPTGMSRDSGRAGEPLSPAPTSGLGIPDDSSGDPVMTPAWLSRLLTRPNRAARRAKTCRPSLEALDRRDVPAVTATFTAATGVLSVTGDDLDNVITVSPNAAGSIPVNGGAGPIGGDPGPTR